MQLEIRLFGEFRVAVGGTEVAAERWPRRKATLLLKLLALQPSHRLHQEQVMAALWPEASAEAAANNLNKLVHMARRALEPTLAAGADSRYLRRSASHVELRAPEGVQVDADEFERLAAAAVQGSDATAYRAALAAYRGDLLPEHRFEDWCEGRREELRRQHLDLLWRSAVLLQEQGQTELCLDRLTEVIARDPLHERAHRQLMREYAALGRRELALRQFADCSAALRRELDAEPEAATTELYRQIVAGELSGEAAAATPRTPTPTTAKPEPTARFGLAVLPFHNTARDPTLDYLCDGIAESLINTLSQLPALRVMAFSTVLRYRGGAMDPLAIGRDLGVQAVVLGRVIHWSERLVVGAELVRTEDGARLWGDRFNRALADIFEVQDGISSEISEGLSLQLTTPERRRLGKRHTDSTRAYELYLKGRHYWNQRTGDGLRRGIECFEEAIDADPTYALAYSGLADCHSLLGLYSTVAPGEAMPRARSAALRALALDDGLAEAHTSLAYTKLYYDWDWAEADAGFDRAIRLSPNYATAHQWRHEYLTAMGRFDEQHEAIECALHLDPLSPIIQTEIGWGRYFAGDCESALHHASKTLELTPGFGVAHLVRGLAALQLEQLDLATAELERAIGLATDAPFTLAIGALGHALARRGEPGAAREQLARLTAMGGAERGRGYSMALVQLGLRDEERALDALEAAFKAREDRLVFLRVEPLFADLHALERYQQLLSFMDLDHA
ncbi:MAG: BTAD domain-containing putative transcriptional regulator [Planctomycetota bacterium]